MSSNNSNNTTKERQDVNFKNNSFIKNTNESINNISDSLVPNNNNNNNNNNNSNGSNNNNNHIHNVNCTPKNTLSSPPIFSLINQSYVNPIQVFIVCSKWTSFLNGRTVKNFLVYKKDINKSYTNKITSDLVALNINTSLEDSLYLLSENGVASSPVMEEDEEVSSSDEECSDSDTGSNHSNEECSEGVEISQHVHVISPDELQSMKNDDQQLQQQLQQHPLSISDGDIPLNLSVLANNNNNNNSSSTCSTSMKKRNSFYRRHHHLKGNSNKKLSPYHHGYNNHNTNCSNSNNNTTGTTANGNGNGIHSFSNHLLNTSLMNNGHGISSNINSLNNSNDSVDSNGSSNGSSNGNGHGHGNGKSPLSKSIAINTTTKIIHTPPLPQQPPQPTKKKYKYIGLVGVLDILSFMSYLLHRRNILGLDPDHVNILKQSLKQVISFSTLNDMRFVKDDMSLLQALEVLVSKSPPFKVHRVPVFNAENELVGILSQTDFLYLARENLHQLTSHANKTIKELKIMFPVISIPSDTMTKDAFQLLRANRINGVAITDSKNGRLFHCLSSDDLKNITSLKFDLLFKSINEYLEASSGGIKTPTIITEDTLLVDVIIKMCDFKVQRLFTVDSNFKPLTVTTISDVLLVLLNC